MKSKFLNDIENKINNTPFFHFTGDKEEKEYIRENGCTYVIKDGYGGKYAIIKDKKTKEFLQIPIYEN